MKGTNSRVISRIKVVGVIPALNEEKTLKKVVEGAILHTNKVIVVDDGSVDKTSEEAIDAGAIVIKHEKQCGVGRAYRTGVKKALEIGADLIVTLDADGEHDPDAIPELVQATINQNVDIVIGSRFLQISPVMPQVNKLSNKISTFLFNKMFGTRVTDSQSGFRVYKRIVFEEVDCREDGFLYLTEMLVEAVKRSLRVTEVPIASVHRRDKRLSHSLKEILEYPGMLLRLKWSTRQ